MLVTKDKEEVKLPNPFQGRLILKALREDTEKYLNELKGVAETDYLKSKGFTIATVDEHAVVPLKKGKIVNMAPDAFGKRYVHNYGDDGGEHPNIGDIVMFVPHQQYNLDPKGEYCIISDEHVIAWEKE